MKNFIFITSLFIVATSTSYSANYLENIWDFMAPVISDKDTDVPNYASGLIIYETTDDTYYGRLSDGTWRDLGLTTLNSYPKSCFIKDVQPSGTQGGTFNSGSWQTRVLNTAAGDCEFLTLSSNQFTLQAGDYEFDCSAPAQQVDANQAKIRDIDTSSDVLIGMSVGANNNGSHSVSRIIGKVSITSSTNFEL